jgi:hypothetical protein
MKYRGWNESQKPKYTRAREVKMSPKVLMLRSPVAKGINVKDRHPVLIQMPCPESQWRIV